MRARKANETDLSRIIELARALGLDYPGMEGDALWVAEDEGGWIVGSVALKKHPDCLELCALGVEPASRGRGVARALVEALMAEAPGPVHLATVIPGFFEDCGFERTPDVPWSFIERRATAWCDGCDRSLCTVMLRKTS
jgi:N-acetylglutamate synthase-like GNAT family acetyltransferase